MTVTAAEPWTTARHPLARLLRGVAAGSYPQADGTWTRVSPWIPTVQAMVGFSGHTIVAVSYDVSDDKLVDVGVDGQGNAFSPRVIASLAGPTGWIGVPQTLLVNLGTGSADGGRLVARPDLSRHPFVESAKRTRQDIQVLGTSDPENPDIVVLGRGVAGIREISVLVHPSRRGRGLGATLARDGLGCVPEFEVVLASIPSYDASALRCFLGAGFTAIGGVQLFSNRPEHKL